MPLNKATKPNQIISQDSNQVVGTFSDEKPEHKPIRMLFWQKQNLVD